MSVSPRERTRKAREAFNSRFSSEQEKSEHFAELARKRQGSVVLSADEAEALSGAYDVLRRVAERARKNGGADA